MEPAAVGALIISSLSLMGTAINSFFTAKTYKKNRRLEFLHRSDRLSQQISDLNRRNGKFQRISARYQIVAVKNALLPLRGEQADRTQALVASIKVQAEGVESGRALWNERIKELHFLHSNLIETDAPKLERMIGFVQEASDTLAAAIEGYSSVLHILETTHEMTKATFAEAEEKIRQIDLDYERARAKLMQ